MAIDRRELFVGAGLIGLAGPALLSQAMAQAAPAQPSRAERIAAAAREHRHRIDFRGGRFSGPGWDQLVARGRESHFFLLGEQHGISENARLAGALFAALAPAGYAHVAVEISPPMASEMDRVLREGGLDALRGLFDDPGSKVAFFGMREEAEWLAAARAALPGGRPFLWGMDYEVAADRHLIAMLKAKRKPAGAEAALGRIESASAAAWALYARTRDLQEAYTFTGDPALVRALRAAWPRADAEAAVILDTLEGTFEANQLWRQSRGHESNARRAALMRANFLRYWRAEKAAAPAGHTPRLMMKMGSNHMMRGLTPTDVFDLGTLVPEIAAAEGAKAYQLLVMNGLGTQTAQFDARTFTYRSAPESEMHAELAPIFGQAFAEGFTLFETAPLRAIARTGADGLHPDLVRAVHGHDAILLLSGSTPSANL